MIYIYNDFGGTHTTAMAAAYHLKLIALNRQMTNEEILSIPFFNQLNASDMGKIIFHGTDDEGNPVYTVGRGASKHVLPAMIHLSHLLKKKYQGQEKIIFSNTSPTVPFVMTIGGLFSRWLKIDFIGVPLLASGARKCSETVIRLVEQTRETGKKADQEVTVLQNQSFKP